MSKSTWILLALNALAAFVAFVAAGGIRDPDGWGIAVLAAFALAVNSVVVAVRDRGKASGRARSRTGARESVVESEVELDAATVLDLDARLEALERAQADAADAAKWRALVESGQVSGPAAEALAGAAPTVRRPMANGQ